MANVSDSGLYSRLIRDAPCQTKSKPDPSTSEGEHVLSYRPPQVLATVGLVHRRLVKQSAALLYATRPPRQTPPSSVANGEMRK